MKCYGLGLALNTWKVVALTQHFRKLEVDHLEKSYATYAPHPPLLLRRGSCRFRSFSLDRQQPRTNADGILSLLRGLEPCRVYWALAAISLVQIWPIRFGPSGACCLSVLCRMTFPPLTS